MALRPSVVAPARMMDDVGRIATSSPRRLSGAGGSAPRSVAAMHRVVINPSHSAGRTAAVIKPRSLGAGRIDAPARRMTSKVSPGAGQSRAMARPVSHAAGAIEAGTSNRGAGRIAAVINPPVTNLLSDLAGRIVV